MPMPGRLDLSALVAPGRSATPAPAHPAARALAGDDAGRAGSDEGRGAAVSLTSAQAALRGLLFRRRGPLMLRQGPGQAALTLTALPAGELPAPADTPWLSLTIDGAPAALALPWSMARRLAGRPLEAADPEDAALLLEDALTDWLDAGELATGLAIRLLRLDQTPPPDGIAVRLGVDLALPRPARQAAALRLSPGAAQALAAALARNERPRDALPGLALRVWIERPAARLTLGELRSLAPGDALLLPPEAEEGEAVAVVEQRLAAPVRAVGPGCWVIEAPLAPRPMRGADIPWTAWRNDMSDTDPATAGPLAPGHLTPQPSAQPAEAAATSGPDSPAEPAGTPVSMPQDGAASAGSPAPAGAEPPRPVSLDGLELRLSVRVGEALVPLSELRQAGPGTVIVLDRPDGALVDLVVNGQVVGTGQIITVAGQKACEIRSLFGDG
ncbi:FliM/FliN family flagellar motor switch protein [Paracoccus contaminans]|nr:FliM/FliN family flagellar motor switch protein [Paracoccus contaminans]